MAANGCNREPRSPEIHLHLGAEPFADLDLGCYGKRVVPAEPKVFWPESDDDGALSVPERGLCGLAIEPARGHPSAFRCQGQGRLVRGEPLVRHAGSLLVIVPEG